MIMHLQDSDARSRAVDGLAYALSHLSKHDRKGSPLPCSLLTYESIRNDTAGSIQSGRRNEVWRNCRRSEGEKVPWVDEPMYSVMSLSLWHPRLDQHPPIASSQIATESL